MKALIIEDNDALRMLYQLFLSDLGFNTDEAPDGKAGFEKIEQYRYDVIVSDMDMPYLNGMELYKLTAARFPSMVNKFLFSTGNTFDEEYKQFFRSIPCPVLFKPFSQSEFEKAVEGLIKNPV